MADCEPEGNLATLAYYDLVKVLDNEREFRRVVRVVIGAETRETEMSFAAIFRREARSAGQILHPDLRAVKGFVGREDLIEELDRLLEAGKGNGIARAIA